MKTLDPITNMFLHQIAQASRYPYTVGMVEILMTIPVDFNPATQASIEAFDIELDGMESDPTLSIAAEMAQHA